jgi:undecaprenyl-diphosphatase
MERKKRFALLGFFGVLLFFLILLGVLNNLFFQLDIFVNENFGSAEGIITQAALFFNLITKEIFLIIISIAVLGALVYSGRVREGIFFSCVLIFSFLIKEIIKFSVQRSRPENALFFREGFSFPSGHVLIAFVFIFLIVYLFSQKIKSEKARDFFIISVFSVKIFVSLSRVYLRMHWFTDVIGSIFLGLAICGFSVFIFENYIAGLSK